ncbi:hypothetical protein PI124_g2755 [Phytophthora idaei]|nr:hypothetical protein PI125_g2640 [Phytophthora idaei]KAG3171190.1 hypothetical protein PI126_g1972 [Phytophthora idaei]KAG3252642.1 hypothetical protein PI124_g2755 [Phytophthora idaei]
MGNLIYNLPVEAAFDTSYRQWRYDSLARQDLALDSSCVFCIASQPRHKSE